MEIINTIGDLHKLKNKSPNYTTFEDTMVNVDELLKVKNEMVEYLEKTPNAMGVSAPQFGVYLPIFVFKTKEGIKNFINPIVQNFKQPYYNREGCMSLPEIQAYVVRFKHVKVEYLQFNHKNELKPQKKDFVDQEAACFQHELDHLWGFTILDRAIPLTEDQAQSLDIYKISRIFKDEDVNDFFFEEGDEKNIYFYSGEIVPEFKPQTVDGIESDAPLKKSFVAFKVIESESK